MTAPRELAEGRDGTSVRGTPQRPAAPRVAPNAGPRPPLVIEPDRPRLSVAGPDIRPADIDAVARAAATAWHSGAGRFVAEFEQAFAAVHAIEYAVATPSCTAALHLALAALGIGPGDEVIVPDLTWIASAAPVDYVGATPVFVDVDPTTWCIDAASVEAAITARTRAILAVDLYGNLPDFARLREIADHYGLALIEDAAQAIGTRRGARRAGTWGDVGVFSFHGSKTLTTGEGGMLITADRRLHDRVRRLQDHGRRPGDRSFDCDEVGFKYRMTDLQAALGHSQLGRLDEIVGRKQALFAGYAAGLSGLEGVQLNAPGDDVSSSYWMTTLVLSGWPGAARDALAADLAGAGIDTRPVFPPLSRTRAYRNRPEAIAAASRNPHAAAIGPRGINLPSALNLTDGDVARVLDAVRSRLDTRS